MSWSRMPRKANSSAPFRWASQGTTTSVRRFPSPADSFLSARTASSIASANHESRAALPACLGKGEKEKAVATCHFRASQARQTSEREQCAHLMGELCPCPNQFIFRVFRVWRVELPDLGSWAAG